MKTPEQIAPKLWNAYKDKLHAGILWELEQLICDTDKHGIIRFDDKDSIRKAFVWDYTKQGQEFWSLVDEGKYSEAHELPLPKSYGKVASTGGSSDCYELEIEGKPYQVEDVIYAMVGGDFALGNVLKAARRMYLDSKGQGKEGVNMSYDANKIKYFADSFVKRFGKEENNG